MSNRQPSAPFTVPHNLEDTPYQLVELLGQGGMGAVYRAVNTLEPYSEPRAIKFCLDPDRVRLLHREKQLLERLQRDREQLAQGLVRLFGYRLDGPNPFLVYEYISGGDLAAWLRANGPQSPSAALAMVRNITRALGVVHRAGLVHRDLKPTNILMDRSGPELQVKLSDFGIGAVVQGADLGGPAESLLRSTQAHTATLLHGTGTPLYMCVEQARGEAPDPRHDLYALGVIWFQILLGDPTHPMVLGWEDLLAESPRVPDGHLDLIDRCVGIQKHRPATADDLLDRLEAVSADAASSPTEPATARAAVAVPRPSRAEPLVVDLDLGERMDMALIPPGTFRMGSAVHERGRSGHEGPVHEVTIHQPFYLARTPVTQAQWQAVMGANPSGFEGDVDLPVEMVSWHDCQAFCLELSERTGRRFRLPSEAEWEYACRAGTTTRFYFGDDWDESLLPEYAWFDRNSGNGTKPVGQLPPNGWNLCDMHGNVWNWCEDVWHDTYAGAPADGSAWVEGGDADVRVLRGGSWGSLGRNCRSALRGGDAADTRDDSIGFRPVMVVAPSDPA